MPRYKVIAPGFFDGKYYKPDGKRSILETDKPFTKKNPMPSWLADLSDESAAVKAKREAQEESKKAAKKSLEKSLKTAKATVEKAAAAVESADDESKPEAQRELTKARNELQMIQDRLNELENPEQSTQEQVATAASVEGEGEPSFLDKVKGAITGNSDKVETL